ncbi:MAG: DUF1929 domain-containing protein [Acidobacteria bacterium]|nr:DUF1929 domain-containing protein [Acidobacteriota bacterium]
MIRTRIIGIAALCLAGTAIAFAQVQQTGQWAPIVNWPFVPIGVTHLADGRIVGWASTQTTTFPAGATFTHAAIYDPATNTITSMNKTQHDTFCAGLATTGDGRIILSGGGADVRTTSVLGMLPRWNQSGWTRLNDMINGRWYNSSITMNDGNILTMWGRSGGTLTEIFSQSTNLWTAKSGISLNPAAEVEDGNDEPNNRYPHLHWMPNGKILLPGPLKQMYWLDVAGNGSTQLAGTRTPDVDRYRKLAASVQFLPGKILFAGGLDGRYNPKVFNTAVVIDATSGTPVTTATGSMSFSSAFHNLVVLPNGEVFVAGGNSSGTKFSDAGGILPAEMWNPTTGLWRTLPSMAEPRGYHFLAILLRDGRVWAGGGGLCGCVADHLNGQIYSPGYLFNADGSAATRPQINLAPNDLKPGLTIGVTGSDDITGFRLIRLQATTHGYNSDQRYVPVTHTKTGTGSYSLTLDSSQDVLVPGGYWLFAVNANGTPSIGYNVQVYTTATWPGGAGGETNLAIGKSATQSSTASGGVAARAVDGNTNGDFSQNSVIQTNSQSQPYWQVDLGARAQIANVKIWNRSDCCAANLTNFHVFVSDQPFTGTTVAQSQAQAGVTDIPHSGTAGATVTLAVNRSARYLRVQLEGTAALNFAEFEAIGTVITNNPPSVSITSPAPGTSVPAPGSFTIAANASDPENNLSKVEFYNGATKLGEDLVAPYSFVWSGIAAGNYTITARAIDTQGLFTDASVNVSVTSAGNAAPTVSIVSRLSGAMFTAAADVVFNVTAADPDNNLQKVELFNGAVKVGELTAAPFTFTVLNLAAGTYSFSARATDFPGLSTTHAITIRVVNRQIQSLRGVPVPDPAAINSYIKNRPAAVALGKALFWDMQVSSDGAVACASCHFHAGADLRLKNQMNPGTLRTGTPPMTFDNSRAGSPNGPNYTTVSGDFPRHLLTDPANPNSAVVYTSKDVMGSHGQFLRNYTSATAGAIADACATTPDPVFGAARRSTGRNTPPVINAIFNVRNFWDGRANSIFNGVDSFGPRNTNARIYRGNPPVALAVSLDNASLASQAVAAPLNSSEMSCASRTWPEIAKRLLAASALARQNVLTTDSVLGSYSRGAALKGLNKTHLELVQAAFADDLHTSPTAVNIGGTNYTQAQANFSLFFGLALQLYQATLVSDQAPIDTYFAPYPSASVETASALTPEQITGLNVFNGKGRCASCHHGPQLTNAATPAREANAFGALISKMLMGNGSPATYDIGYYNIGVRPTSEDLGIGGVDPFGNPLSITRQIKAGANVDGISIDPCTFAVEPCLPLNSTSRDAVDGAFKTPSLRNVSLTGPYFHNGSLATLEEVVDFYNRGGDATTIAGGDSTGFGPNSSNSHPDIGPLALTAIEK